MNNIERKIPSIIAHRGYSGKYSENTLIAYEEAIHANVDGLEGDVRLSKDGEVIIMHDLTLHRTTTGIGLVHRVPWKGYIEHLATKTTPPQPIPRLRDVIDLLIRPEVVVKNITMIIDIKFDNPLAIIDAIYDVVKDYQDYTSLKKQLVFGIWNTAFLEAVQHFFPGYEICYIGSSVSIARKHYLPTINTISLCFDNYMDSDGQSFIKEVHALGKKVLCWTVNDTRLMQQCVAWGVDGIIGDHVDTMVTNIKYQVKAMDETQYEVYMKESQKLYSSLDRLYYYGTKHGRSIISRVIVGQ
ncbi:PLC-like phosphodiesterase [Spinellus fusiger]|nr:PLC-like phosphodiesterase [Spinellus fusiger]